jgi:CIC family chloride channel protein
MTAIVMIFEMTLDYNVIIPLTITVAISYEIRKILSKESIYTLKLARRGHFIPDAMRKNYHEALQAHQIMITNITSIDASSTLKELADLVQSDGNILYFIVKDRGKVVGVVPSNCMAGPLTHIDQNMLVKDIAINEFEIISSNAAFLEIVDKIRENHTSFILVMKSLDRSSEDNVVGIITKDELTNSISITAGLFSDNV